MYLISQIGLENVLDARGQNFSNWARLSPTRSKIYLRIPGYTLVFEKNSWLWLVDRSCTVVLNQLLSDLSRAQVNLTYVLVSHQFLTKFREEGLPELEQQQLQVNQLLSFCSGGRE